MSGHACNSAIAKRTLAQRGNEEREGEMGEKTKFMPNKIMCFTMDFSFSYNPGADSSFFSSSQVAQPSNGGSNVTSPLFIDNNTS